ncbi:MAG: DUF4263 domain-containing protein [Pyrinomonadaceae bacterium]|nr:DUF4263 domain-containing protein [Pyrinomonadaceae bacterium]
MILVKNIPIYGDNEIYQETVDRLLSEILHEGIIIEGKKLKLTRYNDFNAHDIESIIKILSKHERVFPFEINIINKTILPQLKIASFINRIDEVIIKLKDIVCSEERNENKIQSFLTENPVLLGTEYKRVIPKHLLGAEYEMDYALERYDGIYDLIEIESSNLKLFTKQGNPTKELVHAEQQVLDWQQWVEEKNFYAQEKLKGISSPKGFIIIGRYESENDKKKLKRRNATFNGIQILTYNDLIEKAKTLLSKIKSEG